MEQRFKRVSCNPSFPPPYSPGTDYWEIVLEKCQIFPDFENNSPNENVRLVFFGEKTSKNFEKKFVVDEKYLFYCNGGSEVYWPHNWERLRSR